MPAPKRKGSTIFKDEERVTKRRLRSGRTIETSTSPLRLAKVVSVSASSDPRAKPFTSTNSAMKFLHVDIEHESDDNHDEICLTPLQPSQAAGVVRSKRTFSNETNMDWTSPDMGLVEKQGLQREVYHGKLSTHKAKLARKTTSGIPPDAASAVKLMRYVGDKSTMESGSSLELLQFPEKSPTKTVVEVTIYTPRKKPRRLSIVSSEDPDISPRIHDPGYSLQGAVAVSSFKTTVTTLHQSGSQTSNLLPSHLHSCLNAQKRAILRTLQRPSARVDESDLFTVNEIATRQLADLMEGTVIRAEGNSCLLLGPRGSGKSRVSGFLPL